MKSISFDGFCCSRSDKVKDDAQTCVHDTADALCACSVRFQSERESGDRNFAIGYYLKEKKVSPQEFPVCPIFCFLFDFILVTCKQYTHALYIVFNQDCWENAEVI